MISHLNNHVSDRTALIDIDHEILPTVIPVLLDAGFRIVGTENSSPMSTGILRLIVSWSALPLECGLSSRRFVTMTFEVEAYGAQKITRVREVILVDKAKAA